MPSVGVFAAIFDAAQRVLCVRHNYGARDWGMPGGKVEPGEDPLTGIEREVFEESGIVAEITQLVGVYSAPYRDDLVMLFSGRVRDQLPWSSDHEIAEREFFPLTNLPQPMAPNARLRFEDIRSNASGVMCTFASPGARRLDRSLPGWRDGTDHKV